MARARAGVGALDGASVLSPGARAAIISWQDANGNAWLFGGYTYDDPTNTRFEMSDLWKYPTN